MKDKVQIHQFDPVIYPCRIFVAVKPSFEDVTEVFYGLNKENDRYDISHEQFDRDRFTIATVFIVSHKKNGWIGLFVSVWKPGSLDVKTICHESSHCADYICEKFGISNGSYDEGEARAYLQGWIADCIYKVKLGKE